jgi:site-specific DNA recombinase
LREFEAFVVPSPDRLARNYVHQMVLIEELEKAGCKVEFVERPMSSEPKATNSFCRSAGQWPSTSGRC